MFGTLRAVGGGTLPAVLPDRAPVLATARVLPVPEPLAPLLVGAGLRRGSLVGVSGPGGTSLLLSLLAEPLAQGSWAGVVGLGDLGLEAAAGFGVELARVALIPDPGAHWTAVVAVLLDAVDLVALRPPGYCRPPDARRLTARARERGSTLLVVSGRTAWPEAPDVELIAESDGWGGLEVGSGTLRRRPARIVVSGRRAAARSRSATCWLPGPDGKLSPRRSREAPTLAAMSREDPETEPWAG